MGLQLLHSPIGPSVLVYETHDYQIKIEATFHLIFGACINILVMFKVKILVLIKWIIEVPLIMFAIELGMVINIGKTNVNDFNDPKTSRYIDIPCPFIISFPIPLGFREQRRLSMANRWTIG